LGTDCIVLAGGRSTRLGRNKIIENIGNKSLLERVISQLTYFKGSIFVVIGMEKALQLFVSCPEVKIVSDLFPGKGSLGGIYTGLVESNSFINIVVAGDMPFLNKNLLNHMIEIINGFDIVVPRVEGKIEPLHAVYTKECIKPIEALLNRGNLKIIDFFDSVKVKYIEKEEIEKYDPEHLSFF